MHVHLHCSAGSCPLVRGAPRMETLRSQLAGVTRWNTLGINTCEKQRKKTPKGERRGFRGVAERAPAIPLTDLKLWWVALHRVARGFGHYTHKQT